jgi:hypothetical protein
LPFWRSRRGCRSGAILQPAAPSPPTYAIIANCELVTVVVVGATVLGEKLIQTSALAAG